MPRVDDEESEAIKEFANTFRPKLVDVDLSSKKKSELDETNYFDIEGDEADESVI